MKIALISDIHGNMDALEKVLADADAADIQAIIFSGDIAGYYYQAQEVLDVLRQRNAVMCRGNHEDILCAYFDEGAQGREAIRVRYGSSYAMIEDGMSDSDKQFLSGLSHPVEADYDGLRFLVCHGAPWGVDDYIYPDASEDVLKKLESYSDRYDVIVTGHTHYQASWRIGDMVVINPGSVGQPRSGKVDDSASQARAHWAIFDTDDRSFIHCESLYECNGLFKQVDEFDPDLPHLKNVLKRREAAA